LEKENEMKKVLRMIVSLGFIVVGTGLFQAHAAQWDDGDGKPRGGGGCSPRYNPLTHVYTSC
jgi:hypothetical protein